MNELIRVYSRKNIILLIILAVLNVSLFYLSCDDNLAITLSGSELENYIDSYPDFIKFTEKQSRLQLILGDENSFTAASILKTAGDYSRLSDIKLTPADNRGIVVFSDCFLSDIFLACYVFIIIFSLSDIRKKDLSAVIRSTPKGRGQMFFKGIFVILLTAVSGAVLIYGGNFLAVIFRYGFPDLNIQIQSVPEFKLCPFNIKTGEYLFLLCLLKAAGIFSAAMLFYAAINAAGAFTSYFFAGVFVVIQVIARAIPSVSMFNFFRVFNLFSLVDAKKIFSEYCNINIAGKPVTAAWVSVFFALTVIVLSFAAGLIVTEIIYPDNFGALENFFEKIKKFSEKHGLCRSVFSWEFYKLSVKQWGGIIVIMIFGAMLLRSFSYNYFYVVNTYELEWYEKYKGEITQKTSDDMTREKVHLEDFIERLNNSIEKLLSMESYDPNDMGRLLKYREEAENQLAALLPILENVNGALDYTSRTGNTLMLIKPYAYDLLFRQDTKTTSAASLIILAGIVFAVSGAYCPDGREDVRGIIRTALKGRGIFTACKIISVMMITAVLCISVHVIQMIRINETLGFDTIHAPVQSLDFMRDFSPYISIFSYMLLMLSVRTAAAWICAGIVMAVGRSSADRSKTIGISAFVFALLIFGAGALSFDFINILYWLGVRIL